MLTILIVILAQAIVVSSEFNCVGTCYSGRLFPLPKDIVYGKHIRGYSYRNITTDDAKKCYSSCVNDCRCKACQTKDARCELMDEDHTSKPSDFVDASRYVYYELKQGFYKGLKSHMVQPGVCHNGCCRSQPCMNGGKCIEHCDTPKEKFTCTCTPFFIGSVCQREALPSCMEYLRKARGATPINGKYTIYRRDNDLPIDVYCDFKSPKQAWTLIESFNIVNNNAYRSKALHVDYERNPNFVTIPNWDDYRLSLTNMKYLSTKSTMFRSTCDFPNRSNQLTPDYLFGYMSDYDIINHGDVNGKCIKFSYINVKGIEFLNKKARVFHGNGFHFHMDSNTNCGFSVPGTAGEEFFGYYGPITNTTKCSAQPHARATTQWWLGEEIE